jgi:hypothetical protein
MPARRIILAGPQFGLQQFTQVLFIRPTAAVIKLRFIVKSEALPAVVSQS